MKIRDLDLDTVYAVKVGNDVYRAVVLFDAVWRDVKSYSNGRTTLVGYAPEGGALGGVNVRHGVPVYAALTIGGTYGPDSDDALRSAAVDTRAVMRTGGRPENVRHIMLVQANAIRMPWVDYLQVLASERAAADAVQAGRVAEQVAQDQARERVLAVLGQDRWGFSSPPSTWTAFESLVIDYAEAIGGALVDVMSGARLGEDTDELGAMAFAKIILEKRT